MAHPLRTAGLGLLLTCLTPHLPAAEVPFPSRRVNDLAEILSPETSRDLERILRSHEDSTSNQVAILTVRSLEGEAIESYALRAAESWRLGQKGKDNRVLLLLAREEVSPETGHPGAGEIQNCTRAGFPTEVDHDS